MMKFALTLAALLLAPLATLNAAEVANLRCEYRENPLGLDEVQPRLSWVMEKTEARSQMQTAYQRVVARAQWLDAEIGRRTSADLQEADPSQPLRQ